MSEHLQHKSSFFVASFFVLLKRFDSFYVFEPNHDNHATLIMGPLQLHFSNLIGIESKNNDKRLN